MNLIGLTFAHELRLIVAIYLICNTFALPAIAQDSVAASDLDRAKHAQEQIAEQVSQHAQLIAILFAGACCATHSHTPGLSTHLLVQFCTEGATS